MKQICTQLVFLSLLFVGTKVYAQTNSLTISKTDPTPTPGFGTTDSVKLSNGFTSTNTGTFEDFAPFQTDTIISPLYYYNTSQSIIYFDLNCSAAASGVATAPTVLIITSTGDTLSASSTQNVKGASIDYYFTFTMVTPLPANTDFKIALIMTLGPKAVTAHTLTTNALKSSAQASRILPVKFTGLYAKTINGNIALTWDVATENNLNGYEIQRSIDGNNFSRIGFVVASGNSTYSFSDFKTADLVYYRIKSVDNNNNYGYSIIVSLKLQQSSIVLKAFPNPVANQLTIQHTSASNNDRIEIASVDGRIIKSIALSSNDQQTTINLSTAKAGVYVVRFINDNSIESLKIVKQ